MHILLKTWGVHTYVNKGAFVKSESIFCRGRLAVPGQCRLLAAFLALFWRCLLIPDGGPAPCQVEFSRAPLLLCFGVLVSAVRQLPLGHCSVACGPCAAAHLELHSRDVRLLCLLPEAPSLLMTCFCRQVLTDGLIAFCGVNCLGKKSSCKVKHCICFACWLQTMRDLFLQKFKVQAG